MRARSAAPTAPTAPGWDWILNAFRLAKQYFPNTKLMLNDYSITNSDTATTQYLQIINILKRENLIDVIGEQGHAFSTTGNMAVHKANLDRLAATGLPLQITELDIDGVASGGVPGDEVQLRDYRRIVPALLGAPGRRGHHGVGLAPAQPLAQRPERADRALQRHAQARGALALQLRARDRAGDQARAELRGQRRQRRRVGTVQADDWASAIGRPNLRTFTWQITGGTGAGVFSIVPGTGELRIADQRRSTRTRPTR